MRPAAHVLLLALTLLGCACGYDRTMSGVVAAYDAGQYHQAASAMQPLLQEYGDAPINGVVFNLEGGSVLRAADDLSGSVKCLDAAYAAVRPYLDQQAETKITEEAAAVVTNQTVRTYRGTTPDRILLNTFQALNYLQRGEPDKANVELNRALLWQQDAVERNADRIRKEQDAFTKAGESKGYDASKTMKDESFRSSMEQAYGPVWDKRGSANYEITFTTYLRGLVLMGRGDASSLDQARQCFKLVAGMLGEPANATVLQDVAMADDATRGVRPPKMVWVLLETGRAPSRKEFRLDIPLFMQQVPYVGAAFPLLEYHGDQVSTFSVEGGERPATASLLCDVDAVVKQDFDDRLPLVITATLVSSASKAVATYFAQRAAGDNGWVVALGGALYQVAMNSADLRSWVTLPKQWLVARVPRPPSGVLHLALGDGQRIDGIQLPDRPFSVVYVKTVRSGTRPVWHVLSLTAP